MKLFSLLVFLAVSPAFAAGPPDIAIPDQSLWPDPIASRQGFDAASRTEILVFLRSFANDAAGTLPGDSESLRRWRARSETYWLGAFRDASRTCSSSHDLGCGFRGSSFADLLGFVQNFQPGPRYAAWLAMTEKFDAVYYAEQKRIATLFPKPTSEILPVTDSEVMGDRFNDGEFLISLDDGPTAAGGTTDATMAALARSGLTAQVFALGDALQARIGKGAPADLSPLYGRNCLGSHGFHHKSHQTWPDWKRSIEDTYRLIQAIRPGKSVPFRPPYGQRTAEVVAAQESLARAPVVLWNLDSQDWNEKMPVDRVADRLEKLMLLWRKGIILMHDVHPKAAVAIPRLARFARAASLEWKDCRSLR